jgi:glycosyltransferase involved in cell wall biosynthesis
VEVIPHGLDVDVFRPEDKVTSRQALGLEPETRTILFVARGNRRWKGQDLLVEALTQVVKSVPDLTLVTIGSHPGDVPTRHHHLGTFSTAESMRLAYSAADLLVVPSREETFGLVAIEAMACGTPVVTFEKTGPQDIVEHRENGYVASFEDAHDLSRGMVWLLEDEPRLERCSRSARLRVENHFSLETSVRQYLSLYRETIG